jgi:hypothetical protein
MNTKQVAINISTPLLPLYTISGRITYLTTAPIIGTWDTKSAVSIKDYPNLPWISDGAIVVMLYVIAVPKNM